MEDLTTEHVHGALAGNQDDFRWLVARFQGFLRAQAQYRILKGQTKNCLPEDLIQETWMVAWQRLADVQRLCDESHRATPRLLTFLSTTLLQRHSNYLRSEIRRGVALSLEDRGDELTSVPQETRCLLQKIVNRDVVDRVYVSIQKLSSEERAILILRGVEQRLPRDVGRLLNLQPNTVSVKYNRVLRKLRALLPLSVFDELPEDSPDKDQRGDGSESP